MSSLAQAIYDDFRKARASGAPLNNFCPVVLNAKQERQQGGPESPGFTRWYTSNNSGKDLWKLKKDKPELFAQQQLRAAAATAGPTAVPPGFKETGRPGWFHHADRNVYFIQATRKFMWFDEPAQLHRELYEGEAHPVTFTGGASSSAAPAPATEAAPKHVLIADLHRAAQAMKADFGHVDKPASMLGLFRGGGAEVAARGCHEKLVRRLAAFRSAWSEQALQEAVAGALADVAAAAAGPSGAAAFSSCTNAASPPLAASVALVVGRRVAFAVLEDGRFHLLSWPTAAPPEMSPPSSTALPRCACAALPEGGGETLFALLALGDFKLPDGEMLAAAGPHLPRGRPRAACIGLLRAARTKGAAGPLAVGCLRLAAEGASQEAAALPPAKRPKLPGSAAAASAAAGPPAAPGAAAGTAGGGEAGQVRVRQILLRYAATGKVTDPVRRRQVSRTQEEAEAQMLEVLLALEAEGQANFPRRCREISECQSALKGGEMAGDIGWLDRNKGAALQQGPVSKAAVKPQVPANVVRAAFELAVGEVHDLVTSEVGVHLIQRTA